MTEELYPYCTESVAFSRVWIDQTESILLLTSCEEVVENKNIS